jgi:hypothetical protein
MNKDKLKEFVTVADALSDEVKDVGFDKRCYDSTPPYKLVCLMMSLWVICLFKS